MTVHWNMNNIMSFRLVSHENNLLELELFLCVLVEFTLN